MKTILITLTLTSLIGFAYLAIKEELSYTYSKCRRFRKHKKTGLHERKTYNGWEQI